MTISSLCTRDQTQYAEFALPNLTPHRSNMRTSKFLRGALAFSLMHLCAATAASADSKPSDGGPKPVPLQNAEVARSGSITAYLIDPTSRYRHGVFGETIEASGFVVERDGHRLIYRLPENSVFEDRRLRLADMDKDGVPEVILIKSYLDRGAAIAVYALRADSIEQIAESQPIGLSHRWLNIAGIADFRGDGEMSIAAVLTPHLSGSLRLYRLADGKLSETARLDGITNHIFGTRNLDLARIDDVDGDGTPDIVLPTRTRDALAAVSFRSGKAVQISRRDSPGRIVALDQTKRGIATVTLDDDSRSTLDLSSERHEPSRP